MALPHPFDPLTPLEISKTAEIVRTSFPGCDLFFRVITLKEPPKAEMVHFLVAEEQSQTSAIAGPARIALVQLSTVSSDGGKTLHEVRVDIRKSAVIGTEELEGRHPHIDGSYMRNVEAACLADPLVQNELKHLDLPGEAKVYIEPWTYATDGMNDMKRRLTMCWFYMSLSDSPDANYFAYPLDVCAEVSDDMKVVQVYHLPSGEHDRISKTPKKFDRTKIHSNSEYHPDLVAEHRTSTKPYHISQPHGSSFQTNGNQLSWEKWTLRIGFNYREGLTLHDVKYDGRSIFYRLSLSEMFVPYGDSRSPYARKAAFDLGNDGAGINANNLQLGCDCLGHVKYFDGWHNTASGLPIKLPNVICCHEIDDGILWKHTNFRTMNAVVARSRVLVLQTIITVSNYEYIFAFHLGQDASIHYEVRATGIISTCPIDIGGSVPYGTIVAPGAMAPFHQHLFSLRIDPAIDGHKNSLKVEESHPLPFNDHSVHNPFGVGYTTSSYIVSDETALDLDVTKNRTFTIINENETNSITGTPKGYRVMPWNSQMLLAHPDSYHSRRSEFAAHAIWVTRYDDDEFFPSGKHTMQSAGGEGIASWVKRRRADPSSTTAVRNEDIVIWHTFGSTHNPRVEDWPVMPCEKTIVGLKPVNFFERNPGLDVAVASQEKNKSVLVR